jgi:hypothetical protein
VAVAEKKVVMPKMRLMMASGVMAELLGAEMIIDVAFCARFTTRDVSTTDGRLVYGRDREDESEKVLGYPINESFERGGVKVDGKED